MGIRIGDYLEPDELLIDKVDRNILIDKLKENAERMAEYKDGILLDKTNEADMEWWNEDD